MFKHEGLSKEFEWVTKESEKNILVKPYPKQV